MITITLTQGKTAVIDYRDYSLVAELSWYARKSHNTYYAFAHVPGSGKPGRKISMHQLLTGFAETDHRNGNGLDNRRSNLRPATKAQNKHNSRRRRDNTSGFKGVSRTQKRWQANIWLDSKQYHLGTYETPEEAAIAYGLHALAAFGEFARMQ